MKCSGRVAVYVTIEAGHTPHTVGLLSLAIGCSIELLLRKLGHEQAQTIELLRVQNAIEQLVEIINRHDLSFRNIAEIGPGCQENRRRKFRQEPVRQIEVHVETLEPREGLNLRLWEDHAADRMVDMWQGQIREYTLLPDLVR